MTTVTIIILAIIAIFEIAVVLYNYYKSSQLDDRKDELDKYSVYLDGRANKLAQWEGELKHWDGKK